MPAYELYFPYSARSFAVGTRVNSVSIIFKDDLKTSQNHNCMDISAKFSKYARKGEVKL